MATDAPQSITGWLSGWLRRVAPPRSLSERFRWLFLMFALLNLAGAAAQLPAGTPAVPRLVALSAALVLASWWARGYRRGTFAAWSSLLEGAALAAVTAVWHDYFGTVGLLFTVVAYRCFFDSSRRAAVVVVVALAGGLLGVAIGTPEHVADFLRHVPGVPILGLLTVLVTGGTRVQELSAAGERRLARAGAALAATSDPGQICRISAHTAHEIISGLPGAWAAMTMPAPESGGNAEPDTAVVVHVTGAAPAGVLAGRPLPAVPDAGWLSMPLRTGKQEYATLAAGADRAVPTDLRASLEALAAQSTLALVNAEQAADLRHQAFHDGLTGLANRVLLREVLQQAIARAGRGTPMAILLLDLDGFKGVNDTLGHAAGDHLLVTVAGRLRDGVRGGDTVARLGGDEFAVVLDAVDGNDHAVLAARRLLAAVHAPLTWNGHDVRPAGSLGVAVWNGHADIDSLLHTADQAMYAAKAAGKSTTACADVTTGQLRLYPLEMSDDVAATAR